VKCHHCEENNNECSAPFSKYDERLPNPIILHTHSKITSNEENASLPDSNHLELSFQHTWEWVKAQRTISWSVLPEGNFPVDTSSNQNDGGGLQWSAFATAVAEEDDISLAVGDPPQYIMPEDVLGLQHQSSTIEYSHDKPIGDNGPTVSAGDGRESHSSLENLFESDDEVEVVKVNVENLPHKS
jgi:hypothetical protein